MRSRHLRSTTVKMLPGALAAAAMVVVGSELAEAKPRARIDPALYRRPLVMTSFVQADRTDVRRNERLTFKFSAIVRQGSLDSRSLRVLEQTGSGTKQAIGALILKA